MIGDSPVIGIMATTSYQDGCHVCEGHYSYQNSYVRRLVECGMTPLFVPLSDNKVIPGTLELCDGLLLPGGVAIKPIHFEVVKHFYDNRKPIFGICMGMQVIAMHSVNIEAPKRILTSCENHCIHGYTFENHAAATLRYHSVSIDPVSRLHAILGQDTMMVNSFHKHTVTEVGSAFRISSKAPDGIIEGVEYAGDDRFCLGVQFHPEFLDEMKPLFEAFRDACLK